MKLIAVGDNVVDYYVDQEKVYPGGNALNVAVFGKRYGVETSSYIGIIGNDHEGDHIEQSLIKEKINVSRIRRVVGESGIAKVRLSENGDRKFLGWNKGGVQSLVKIQLTPEDLQFIHSHTLLHTSVYSNLESELPGLSKDISISFDFSQVREKKYLAATCPYLDFAFFSGSDLTKEECLEFIETVHHLGAKNVGITRGEHGAIFSDSKQLFEQPIVQTKVVDTLGAGDSFIAMFLTKYYESKDIEISLGKAARAAAVTCGYYGAFGYGLSKKEWSESIGRSSN
ncbi:PfkB family carbohydrate kinase [Neobacillus sp. NPDC097160]|uniref:PfkB family carbohydrate kinase n=1 Tax=Neobacillus sp. NPDC097160 TaxID=3364298 RepID=UPI003809DE6E